MEWNDKKAINADGCALYNFAHNYFIITNSEIGLKHLSGEIVVAFCVVSSVC